MLLDEAARLYELGLSVDRHEACASGTYNQVEHALQGVEVVVSHRGRRPGLRLPGRGCSGGGHGVGAVGAVRVRVKESRRAVAAAGLQG